MHVFTKLGALILELKFRQNFRHEHTDTHFPKIVKSFLEHSKTCKMSETGSQKKYFLIINVEKRTKNIVAPTIEQCSQ